MNDIALLQNPHPLPGQSEADFHKELEEGRQELTRKHLPEWPEWEQAEQEKAAGHLSAKQLQIMFESISSANADRYLACARAIRQFEQRYREVSTLQRFVVWLDEQIMQWQQLDASAGSTPPCKRTKAAIDQAVAFSRQFQVDHAWIVNCNLSDEMSYAAAADILVKFRATALTVAEKTTRPQTTVDSAKVPAAGASAQPVARETVASGNPFDNVDPHRHLPAEARAAFWAACQLVLRQPEIFSDTLAWLNEGYSEGVMLQRLLQKSERLYRFQMGELRAGLDLCDTFPRRRALRHGTPRDVLVRQTIDISLGRGRRLRGNECVITNAGRPDDVVVDASNVEVVWRWLDEQCRLSVRRIKENRRNHDDSCRQQAKDRRWRLWEAVQDVLDEGLPAGREERVHAKRVVLLACVLSYQHDLSTALAGEFCAVPWESEGHITDALVAQLMRKPGSPPPAPSRYVPGRITTLFRERIDENLDWCLAVPESFVPLVARAVELLESQQEVAIPFSAEYSSAEFLRQTDRFAGLLQGICETRDASILLDDLSEMLDLAKGLARLTKDIRAPRCPVTVTRQRDQPWNQTGRPSADEEWVLVMQAPPLAPEEVTVWVTRSADSSLPSTVGFPPGSIRTMKAIVDAWRLWVEKTRKAGEPETAADSPLPGVCASLDAAADLLVLQTRNCKMPEILGALAEAASRTTVVLRQWSRLPNVLRDIVACWEQGRCSAPVFFSELRQWVKENYGPVVSDNTPAGAEVATLRKLAGCLTEAKPASHTSGEAAALEGTGAAGGEAEVPATPDPNDLGKLAEKLATAWETATDDERMKARPVICRVIRDWTEANWLIVVAHLRQQGYTGGEIWRMNLFQITMVFFACLADGKIRTIETATVSGSYFPAPPVDPGKVSGAGASKPADANSSSQAPSLPTEASAATSVPESSPDVPLGSKSQSHGEAGGSSTVEGSPPPPVTAYVFRPRPNTTHEVGVASQTLQFLGRGFRYIHETLTRPDTHIQATELHGLGKGLPVGQDIKQSVADGGGREELTSAGFGAAKPLDGAAMQKIIAELTALSNTADAAEETGNGAKSREANDEIVRIVQQCQKDGYKAESLEGKWRVVPQRIKGTAVQRTVGSASGTSARSAVQQAIQDAKDKMREHFPELVQHLDDRLKTGTDVIYLSDTSVVWTLE